MRRIGFLTAVLVLGVSSLSAQTRSVSAGASDPASAMKAKLRNLVTAQESHWADHGTYTTDVAALGMHSRSPADSVLVQVIQAGGRSWWGRAIVRGRSDRSCVIFVGLKEDFTSSPATDGKVKAQGEGVPVCDAF